MTIAITTVSKEPLCSKKLMLEIVLPCHAKFLQSCYQQDDFMNCYRLAQDREHSIAQIRERLSNEQQYSVEKLKRLEWVIRKRPVADQTEGRLIGIASLADYQVAHNRAELLIGILRPEDRNSGLILDASLLVLEFAFHQAKLHKLISIVYGFNEKAQKNALHLGFNQEAVLREHYFNHRTGLFIDLYQNRLLKSEFFASKKFSRWSKRLLGRDITHQPIPNFDTEVMSQHQLEINMKNMMKQGFVKNNR